MIPYPEYKLWKVFYNLEPWGFENSEFWVAEILAGIHNSQVSKRSQLKKPSHWLRDMKKLVIRAIYGERRKQDYENQTGETVDTSTPEGKKMASEKVIAGIKAMFGARVKDTRK